MTGSLLIAYPNAPMNVSPTSPFCFNTTFFRFYPVTSFAVPLLIISAS